MMTVIELLNAFHRRGKRDHSYLDAPLAAVVRHADGQEEQCEIVGIRYFEDPQKMWIVITPNSPR